MFEKEITNALTDMSDIPSYASVSEAVLYVLEANEKNYNELKQEIGLSELGFFEANGTHVVYEAEDETAKDDEKSEDKKDEKKDEKSKVKIKDKIINLISAAWAKIKGLFETVIRKISELVTSASNKIGKKNFKLETLKNGAYTIKKFELKTYDYDNLGKIFDNPSSAYAKSEVLGTVGRMSSGGSVNAGLKGKSRDELEKWFREESKIGDKGSIAEDVRENLRGKEVKITKEMLQDDKVLGSMIRTAYKFDEANKAVKELYKKAKDTFDKQIKSIKAEKEIDNDTLVIAQTASQISTTIFGVALSEYYSLVRRNVSIAAKLASAANSKEGKKNKFANSDEGRAWAKERDEAQNYSGAGYASGNSYGESATYSQEIANLFDWKF